MNPASIKASNRPLAGKLCLIVIGMFGFGFALVPIYNVFCDLTGLNGKVAIEAATKTDYEIDPSREITLEFITAVNESTPLAFGAEIAKMKIIPGQSYTAKFWARNLKEESMTARAVPSVAPGLANQYLKKTECFCFSEQAFGPGEQKIMPVRFVIDPDLPDEYKTVTLAYTFFDISENTN